MQATLLDLSEETWRRKAACKTEDPNLFFPERDRKQKAEAQAICARCPVRTECLQSALDNNDVYGIWGGLEPKLVRRAKNLGMTRAAEILQWAFDQGKPRRTLAKSA